MLGTPNFPLSSPSLLGKLRHGAGWGPGCWTVVLTQQGIKLVRNLIRLRGAGGRGVIHHGSWAAAPGVTSSIFLLIWGFFPQIFMFG